MFLPFRFPHLLALTGLSLILHSGPALAETPKDAVKEHVHKELEGDKDRNKGEKNRGKNERKRPSSRSGNRSGVRRSPAPANSSSSQGQTTGTVGLAIDPELAGNEPRLPKRFLPKLAPYLFFDLKGDIAYRGWLSQQYPGAEVDVASFMTWSVALRAKLFKKLTIQRAYYESTGLVSPRNSKASAAALVGKHVPKGAKFLAMLGFPFFQEWQPILRYQAQSFNTVATPKLPVCIVDRKSESELMDCPRRLDQLVVVSSFETFVAGVQYNSKAESRTFFATNKRNPPPVYLGVGLLSYRKPYQVTVGSSTLEEYLFDGIFRGAGLAAGTRIGGGARRFFATVDAQIGLGEVSLTDSFTLNEVTPDDWLIGYVQGSVRAGYRFVVYEGAPTVYFTPSGQVGGASFHFVKANAEEGEEVGSPNLNWDLLWHASASLEVAL